MSDTIPITLPDLGTEGEPVVVSGWLVDVGGQVEAGDRVVEVLIQGITFDVASPAAGRLVQTEKPMDAVVSPGDVLGWIEERNE